MFKGMKSLVAAAGVAGILAGATAAQAASNIRFDATGGGSGQVITGLNFNAGNALALGANTSAIGETFDVYFHSAIGTVNYVSIPGGGTPVLNTDYVITMVATFSEAKLFEVPATALGFQDNLVPSSNPSFVEKVTFYINTPGQYSDSTGLGFDLGTPILAAENITLTVGGFNISQTLSEWGNFDQRDVNNFPGQYTVAGGGQSNLTASISYVNADYLQGLTNGDILDVSYFATMNTLPFRGGNPSSSFDNGNLVYGVDYNLSTINALSEDSWNLLSPAQQAAILAQLGLTVDQLTWGDDVQFESNGIVTFDVVSSPVIPEPATAAMGLISLVGLAAASRRRR